MNGSPDPSPAGRMLVAGVIAALGAAVLFAPVVTVGFCADAVAGGESVCESWQRSVAGIDSSLWLWLVATVVLVGAALGVARARGRGRARRSG